MEAIQSWVSKHKLATVGGLWAFGIGETLLTYSRTSSPMKPSLRLIHARMHALAVLSACAAYCYYKNRASELKPQAESETPTVSPSVAQKVEWELLSPF